MINFYCKSVYILSLQLEVVMNKTKEIVLCGMFTMLIIVGAFIKIPTPLIPLTFQFLFTMLAGILLGSRLGALSVIVYIALGLIGIPVFASGGGIGYLFKPSFGYLIGFVLGTYAGGKICESSPLPSFKRILAGNFVNMSIVYTFGVLYGIFINRYVLNIDFKISTMLMYGLLIPLPGDILNCFLGAVLGKRLIPILKQNLYQKEEPVKN